MALVSGAPAAGVAADVWSVAVIRAQGVDSDLLELLPKALDGSLRRESSHAAGAIVERGIDAPQFAKGCDRLGIGGCRLGWEATVLKHSGRQANWELAGGLRIGVDLYAGSAWRLALSTTQGFSNAFGRPNYEDGPEGDPGRRYRFQYHMAFELETAHAAWPGWSGGLRIHHRSGMYGLVAPPRVGSNFVGLVVRRSFAPTPNS